MADVDCGLVVVLCPALLRKRRGRLRHEVGVQVVEGGAHFGGVFLVHAEDDGLGEAVGLLQEIGQVAGDGLGAGAQGDDALEVGGGVYLVGNCAAVAVEVVLARAPAGGIPLGDDAMDAVGSEETVVNALLEAVGIDRVAEVEVGVAVVVAQRRGGHAELVGRLEVFEDLAPVAVFLGAAAVALVHDDQVEEVAREFLVKPGPAFVLGDGLVGGEIQLPAEDRDAALDLVPRIAERRRRSCPWDRPPGSCGRRDRGCGACGSDHPWHSTSRTRASSRFGRQPRSCRCRWPW